MSISICYILIQQYSKLLIIISVLHLSAISKGCIEKALDRPIATFYCSTRPFTFTSTKDKLKILYIL